MMPSLFERLLARVFPYRDIVNDGDLYLRRYFLTPRKWPIRLFLHRIYRPDRDRDLHDHPWDFRTLVLWGGYREETSYTICNEHHGDAPGQHCAICARIMVGHGIPRMGWLSSALRKAEYRHRITSVKPNTWTLLMVRRKRRMWGFWTKPEGNDRRYAFIPWRKYLGLPEATPDSEEDA